MSSRPSAGRRTDPALSRNLKPPPLGGGAFTRLHRTSGRESTRSLWADSFELAGAPVVNRADIVHYAVDDPDFNPALKSNLDLAAYLKQPLAERQIGQKEK